MYFAFLLGVEEGGRLDVFNKKKEFDTCRFETCGRVDLSRVSLTHDFAPEKLWGCFKTDSNENGIAPN